MILITDIEDRLLRACETLRAVPDPDKKFQWLNSQWPEVVRSVEDAYGYNDAPMPRFRPSPADVSDMLVALGWARPLDKKEFRLIWWRSFRMSFKHIGFRIYKSDETARRYYKDALIKCWHQANTNEFMAECGQLANAVFHG